MIPMTDTSGSVVLIVDFDQQVCRMLWRILSRNFSMVLTATDVDQAESILDRYEVTHLVADHSFGSDTMNSFEILPIWRQKHQSVHRAVILAGTDISKHQMPKEIDSVLLKTETMDNLVKAVRGTPSR